MAFPTVESAAVTEFFSGPTTSHNVSMPATVDAGDLLLAVVFITGTSTITATGWTEIRTGTTANNNERLEVLAKVAVGNEGGTTVDFQTSSAAYAIVHLYRISGWFGDLAGVEAAVMVTGSGTGPNPPSLTVSWGSDDNLFIAVGAKSTGTVTGAPANFTNLLSGPNNDNMGTARRAIASATQDPGSFSGSTSAQWVATTIGVRPAAGLIPVEGSGDAALPAVAGSGSGAVLVDGSGQAALPGIVAEGVGVVVDTGITGSGEATIPPLTAQGAGAALVDGSGQAALPTYTGEGAGAVLIEGVGESALPAIAASGAGTVYTPEIFGFGEATFAAFVADGAGDVLVIGSGEATVPALVAAGRGFQGEPPEHRAGSEQTVLRRRGFSTTALRS